MNFFISHGHSTADEYNIFKTTPGDNNDGGLSKQGIEEVRNAFIPEELNKKMVMVSSPKKRCRETARIIAERLDIDEFFVDPLLDERDHGVFNNTEYNIEIVKLIEQMDRFGDKPCFKVETVESMVKRVKELIGKYKSAIFVSHSSIGNIFMNLSSGSFTGLHHKIENADCIWLDFDENCHPRNESIGVESYLYIHENFSRNEKQEGILIDGKRRIEFTGRGSNDQGSNNSMSSNLRSYIEYAGAMGMKKSEPNAPFSAFISFTESGRIHSFEEIEDLQFAQIKEAENLHNGEKGIFIETETENIIHEIAHRFGQKSWTVTYWTPDELNKEVFNVTHTKPE